MRYSKSIMAAMLGLGVLAVGPAITKLQPFAAGSALARDSGHSDGGGDHGGSTSGASHEDGGDSQGSAASGHDSIDNEDGNSETADDNGGIAGGQGADDATDESDSISPLFPAKKLAKAHR